MAGIINVQHDHVPGVDTSLVVDRWQARALGFHFATLYHYDLVLPTIDFDHMTLFSLHVSPLDTTGWAVSLPPWLLKRLGLQRDYAPRS